MGNSNSQQQPNQTHSHQPFHPAFHQRGDLIRNGVPYPPHLVGPAASKMPYGPECKVLPERIPGQKLRLTNNGAILQNGGTISGRPRSEGPPPPPGPGPDPEFVQFMMRKRAEEMHMSGYMHKPGTMPPDARYYSHPDLVMVPESRGDETDSSTSGRRFRKKTRAPPPPLSPSAMSNGFIPGGDRPVSRTNSLHEGLPPPPYYGRGMDNGYVNIQPWEQRQMNGHHPLTLSMEKIIERHQLVVQESPMSGANAGSRSETLPWNQRQSDASKRYERQQQSLPTSPHQRTTEITISHERRFYKNRLDSNSKKLSQSEQQLSGNKTSVSDDGRQKLLLERAGIMSEERKKKHLPEARPQARAKSMDSLQVAMELERKAQLQNRHDDIYRNNSAEKPSKPTSKDESFYRTSSMDGRIWDEPRKRPPSRPQDRPYSTGSLQRNLSPSAQYELYSHQKEQKHHEMKNIHQHQYSPSGPKTNDSKQSVRPHRREFSSHPKQYYFGEPLPEGQETPKPTPPVVNHQRQISGSGSGSSKLNETLHTPEHKPPTRNTPSSSKESDSNEISPLLDKSMPMTTDASRSDNKRYSASRGHLAQGRNRNSYAFEDRRYRYEGSSHSPLQEETTREPPLLPIDLKTTMETIDDEMDISMQLRPMLPKRTPAIPRFSPTQAWRSLNLDHITSAQKNSDRSSDDGDVLEDRIHRVTRPVAPPRVGNERSADSGISQDAGSPGGLLGDNELMVSHDKRSNGDKHNANAHAKLAFSTSTSPPPPPLPLPTSAEPSSLETNLITEPGISPVEQKRSTWTPEEDLASDFDGASVDHYPINISVPEMVSVPPKLTPMKSMFASRTFVDIEIDDKKDKRKKPKTKLVKENGTFPINQSNNLTPHTFHSMRTLKRSLSGVLGTSTSTRGKFVDDLQNVDENWSFSRSLPNSLHNGHSGEELPSLPSHSKSTSPLSEIPGHYNMRRAESGPIHPSPTFLGLRARVLSVDCLQEFSSKPHNKNSSKADTNKFGDPMLNYSKSEHIIYLPEYDAKRIIMKDKDMFENDNITLQDDSNNRILLVKNPKKGKKFTYQSTVRQQERRRLEQKLSQEVAHKEKQREREIHMVNKVEEEFQRKREREKANICLQLKVLSDSSHDLRDQSSPTPPPLMSASQLSLYTEELSSSSSPLSSQPSDLSSSKNSPHDKLEKQDSGFFGGISKWMRRQQKLEEQQQQNQVDANGSIIRFDPQEFTRHMELLDPRHEILSAAKYSSGVIPPEKQSPQPEPKSSAYKRLNELVEQEKQQRTRLSDLYIPANGDKLNVYANVSQDSAVQVHRSGSGRAVESAAEVQHKPEDTRMLNNRRFLKNGSNSSFGDSTGSSESPIGDLNGKLTSQWDHYPLDERNNGHQLRSSIEDSECSSDVETDHSNTPRQHSRYRSPKSRRRRGTRPTSRSSSREKHDNAKVEMTTSTLTRLLGRRKNNKALKEAKTNNHAESVNNWVADNPNKQPTTNVGSSHSVLLSGVQPYNPNKTYRPVTFQPWLKQSSGSALKDEKTIVT